MANNYCGIEKYIFSDAYNIFLKYKDVPDVEAYINMMYKDLDSYKNKYHNHPLAMKMSLAVVHQLTHIIGGLNLENKTREQWENELSSAHKMGL